MGRSTATLPFGSPIRDFSSSLFSVPQVAYLLKCDKFKISALRFITVFLSITGGKLESFFPNLRLQGASDERLVRSMSSSFIARVLYEDDWFNSLTLVYWRSA